MSSPRKVVPKLTFNGKATKLTDRIESLSYVDVASGSSDSLDITVRNDDMKWLNAWFPKKGTKIAGSLSFRNWNEEGKHLTLKMGTHILDDRSFSGGPLTMKLSALSKPIQESFSAQKRTKTWEKVTLQKIGQEIAGRYDLKLIYDAPTINISAKEQSEKTDSAFLLEMCKNYGLGFKIYNSKLVIYSKTKYQKKKAVATLTRKSFINDSWEFHDELYGTYTGARAAYKGSSSSKDEVSVYVGLQSEDAKGSRILKINEQSDSQADAETKARAKVDESNESATTVSGTIWPNPRIVSATTVRIRGMGQMDGKYFVDKVTTDVSGSSGTSQKIELHKCYERLSP